MDPKKTDSLAAAAAALPVVKTTALPSNGQVRCLSCVGSIAAPSLCSWESFCCVVGLVRSSSSSSNQVDGTRACWTFGKDLWCCCVLFFVAHHCCCPRWSYSSSSSSSLGVSLPGGPSIIISTVLCWHALGISARSHQQKHDAPEIAIKNCCTWH